MEQWHRRKLIEGTLVYEERPGSVRLGSAPEHTVVFSRLTPIEVEWLRSLSDVNPRGFRHPGKRLDRRQIEMLRLIDAAGLLQHKTDPVRRLRVRVLGLDAVGIGVAVLFARLGVSHLEARDRRRVSGECEQLFPFPASGERREVAVRSLVSQIAPSMCTGKIASPDVAVVCASRVVDHGITGRLLSHDVPHVVVTSDDRAVSVGPVVVPGATACALCADLHVRDRVPGWAQLADAMRTTSPPRVGLPLAQAAAGLAVGFVKELASGILPAVAPGTTALLGHEAGAELASETAFQAYKAKPALSSETPFQADKARLVVPSITVRLSGTGLATSLLSPHPECGCTGLGGSGCPAEPSPATGFARTTRSREPVAGCLPRTG